VFEGLKAGNEVLTQLNKLMDINEVEKLMLDTEDAIAYQQVNVCSFFLLFSLFVCLFFENNNNNNK
jgi:hypothetical protein